MRYLLFLLFGFYLLNYGNALAYPNDPMADPMDDLRAKIGDIPGVTSFYNPTNIPITAADVLRHELGRTRPDIGNPYSYAQNNPVSNVQPSGLLTQTTRFFYPGMPIDLNIPQPIDTRPGRIFQEAIIGLPVGIADLCTTCPKAPLELGECLRAGADVANTISNITDIISEPGPGRYVQHPYTPLHGPTLPFVIYVPPTGK